MIHDDEFAGDAPAHLVELICITNRLPIIRTKVKIVCAICEKCVKNDEGEALKRFLTRRRKAVRRPILSERRTHKEKLIGYEDNPDILTV